MAVQIPPWLNIDPIEPARLASQTAQRRTQEAIAARQAQLREQEMELRYQVEAAHIAQQERAAYRKQVVAEQLAQMESQRRAEEMAMRRELHARQAAQFQQTIKLRQDAAERAAAEAAIQAEGSRGLEADLQAGMPMEKALPRNAGKLFYRHPERMVPAIRSVSPPGAPTFGKTPGGQEYVQDPRGGVHFPPGMTASPTGPVRAEQVVDETGNPTGARVIRGARGGIHTMPREGLSPEGTVRGLTAQLAIIKGQMEEADEKELPALKARRDAIMGQLERLTTPRSPGKLDESTPDEEEDLGTDITPPEGVGDEGEEESPAPDEEQDMVGVGDEE